jgi:ClpP class serine protease
MNFEIWAAEENQILNYLEARDSFLESAPFPKEQLAAFAEISGGQQQILTVKGNEAFISINGILKRGPQNFIEWLRDIEVVSYGDIIQAARMVRENSLINRTTLQMNTIGGEADGVDSAWKELMALAGEKELIAINEGMIASAGYYLASAAHEILATSEANQQGSIGVAVIAIDFSEAREKKGIKKIIYKSANAPNKLVDIEEDIARQEIEKRINTMERFFFERIGEGRGLSVDHIREKFGRGGILFAESPIEGEPDALSVGMIDGIVGMDIEMACKRERRKGGAKSGEAGALSAPVSVKLKQEENMTLQEFLAANPAVKAELDAQLEAKYQAGMTDGVKKGGEEAQNRITQAFGFMKEDSPYLKVKSIQDVALKVVKNEISIDALTSAVASYDAAMEVVNSKNARDETGEQGETNAQNQEQISQDGTIRNAEDWKESMKAMKKAM